MNIKKFLTIALLSTICMQTDSLFAKDKKDYLNDYLPDESLIKNRCSKCKSWLPSFLKSAEVNACDELEEYLAYFDKDPYKIAQQVASLGGYFGNNAWAFAAIEHNAVLNSIKEAIREVLKNEPDESKWQEFKLFEKAIAKIKEEKEQRATQKKLAEEAAAKAEKEANPRGKF